MARVCFPMSSKVNHVVVFQVIHGDSKVNFLFFLSLLHVKFRDPIIAFHVLDSISCYNFLPITILTPLAKLRLSARTRIKYLPYSKITQYLFSFCTWLSFSTVLRRLLWKNKKEILMLRMERRLVALTSEKSLEFLLCNVPFDEFSFHERH